MLSLICGIQKKIFLIKNNLAHRMDWWLPEAEDGGWKK